MNDPRSMLVRARRHPSRTLARSAGRALHGGRRDSAIAGAAICVAAWWMPSNDARAFQVCDRSCKPTDAACLATVAACETKIHAYNLYTGQMGSGVGTHHPRHLTRAEAAGAAAAIAAAAGPAGAGQAAGSDTSPGSDRDQAFGDTVRRPI